MLRSTLPLAAALATTATCWAGELSVGDKAPAAKIEHVLKGEALEGFEDGNIYVLEFWATWCGPCKKSMPHISKLQEHYKDYDVAFVGISDEPLDTVKTFLSKAEWDKKTRYTVTTDPDKSVYKDYMDATGSRGIPTAFIVGKDGTLEWYGHPMEIDNVIEGVVKDTWDREAFKQVLVLRKKLQKAMADDNTEAAIDVLDELIELDPNAAGGYRFRMFSMLAMESDNAAQVYEVGNAAMKDSWDDAPMLNQLAWFTVDQKGVKNRDLDFAMKAAKRANELTEGSDAAILDTVARIYYDQGNLNEAIAWQKKAVKAAGDDSPMAKSILKALEQYEAEAK